MQSRWNEDADLDESTAQLQEVLDRMDPQACCVSAKNAPGISTCNKLQHCANNCASKQCLCRQSLSRQNAMLDSLPADCRCVAAQLQEVQTQLRQTQRAAHNKRGELNGLEGHYAQVGAVRSLSLSTMLLPLKLWCA